MLEASSGKSKGNRWSGLVAFGLMMVAGCCTVNAAPGTRGSSKPKPEAFDQNVVDIMVSYGDKGGISVQPEKTEISFQWHRDKKDRLKPVQVRWVVRGLKKDHVLHIVPKEDAPKGVFPIPEEFQGRPAYSIDGRRFNSIVSGQVEELPYLKKDKGYVKQRREVAGDNDPSVVWAYDVIVADRNGEVLFRVDPEIIILGHP